ncbi:predicted GPI-anchored protein 58 [Selaginella moellendorffii]|uniref:predicted GPI-anchored protein 58 n=1 Tax=Selaginella moellendorffii TaxID=88036 RepID=UPI000D1D1172|nr:predicted GPI-anchored protein 58 [Selaginella moellendorffii]|eukprot:XP_024542108.1 predicted GPI-anchored protein 58 [Selaginella moellendorffii]
MAPAPPAPRPGMESAAPAIPEMKCEERFEVRILLAELLQFTPVQDLAALALPAPLPGMDPATPALPEMECEERFKDPAALALPAPLDPAAPVPPVMECDDEEERLNDLVALVLPAPPPAAPVPPPEIEPAAPVPPELECDEQKRKRPRFLKGEAVPLDEAPHTPETAPHAPETDADPAALQPPLPADLAPVLPAAALLPAEPVLSPPPAAAHAHGASSSTPMDVFKLRARRRLQLRGLIPPTAPAVAREMPEVGFCVEDDDWEWKVDIKELFGSCFQ